VSTKSGTLFIVATPIGNLEDLSPRAQRVLAGVDRIAAEDTRHSRRLLDQFGITTPMLALHEHNEPTASAGLIARLLQGEDIALISDAGTPLISDPGYVLVREARQAGIQVVPVPGPSALITALSACGLPTDRFVYEGFLPSKQAARRSQLEQLATEARTLVFYESPHRIEGTLADLREIFGDAREAVLARELTKRFETFLSGDLATLAARLHADEDQRRGEFVIIVRGAPVMETGTHEGERVLRILLEELPLKQAAHLAAAISGERKNDLYQRALDWQKQGK
jgi:16S rRNA (cytidine1402-2'-O)-methyltransferase